MYLGSRLMVLHVVGGRVCYADLFWGALTAGAQREGSALPGQHAQEARG
jgi:hypothetical protein